MKHIKNLLWVPTGLGIVMGGLALVRLYANGVGAEFVAIPAAILQTYVHLMDALEFYLIGKWFDIDLPNWLRDLVMLWIVVGISNARSYMASHETPIDRDTMIWRVFGFRAYLKEDHRVYYFFLFLLLVLAGPLFVPIILIQFIRQIIIMINEINRIKTQMDMSFHYDVVIRKLFTASLSRMKALVLYIFVLILHPLAAALFLWWNAAEIARLTSGVR